MHADMEGRGGEGEGEGEGGQRGGMERGGLRWKWREEGRGAVTRRSRLSFQCEEVERGTQQNICLDVQTTQKPHPEETHAHANSTRLSVYMYSVKSEGPGGATCAWDQDWATQQQTQPRRIY